jgi:hypothetical protein
MTALRGTANCLPDRRTSHASSLSRSAYPLPTTSHDDDQVQVDVRWPSTACASFERQAPTLGRRHAGMDMAGDHADPGHPSGVSAGPTATPRDLIPSDTADAATHGRRGPDTGHLNAKTPAPDTGHVDRHPWDTGRSHRTLDTGCRRRGRGHGDDSTAGIRTLPGRHAERPHAETRNRVCALALPAGCSAAPLAKRRLGALVSSDDFGSRVERTVTLHPLWL